MAEQNKTPDDAFKRMLAARMGYLVDATDEYLVSLQARLHAWADEIRLHLNVRLNKQKEFANAD